MLSREYWDILLVFPPAWCYQSQQRTYTVNNHVTSQNTHKWLVLGIRCMYSQAVIWGTHDVYDVCCVLTQQSARHLWSNPAEPHSGGSDEESKPPQDEYSFSQGRQERIVSVSHYTCRIKFDFIVRLCVWDLGLVPLEILLSDHPRLALLPRQLRLRVLFGVCIQLEVSHHILELINAGTRRNTEVSWGGKKSKLSSQQEWINLFFLDLFLLTLFCVFFPLL